MNTTQQRFEGFLNTPVLWKDSEVYYLTQFKIEQELLSFDQEIDSNQRLGKYIERFVSHQLVNTEGVNLIAENIQISKDKITLGELDCLLFKNEKPIHLEVIYKFYLFDPNKQGLHCWVGPNKKDSLIEKLEKLQQKQLPLLYSKECTAYLKSISLDVSEIEQQVYFKAQLFVPFLHKASNLDGINSECIAGFYLNSSEVSQFSESKFYIPSKKDWLMTPTTNLNWKRYDDFIVESNSYHERDFSPMCWMKTKNGELHKFFLVWWQS